MGNVIGKIATPKGRPSLIGNAFSNWFVLGLNMLVSFFLTPYIIGALGKDTYGIWTIMVSFIGYYGVLDLGIRSAVIRYIARYSGQKDQHALNETASSALMMFTLVGVIVSILSFFIAGPLSRFINIGAGNVDDFRWGIWLLGIATGISFPANVIGAVIQGHEFFVGKNIGRASLIISRTIIILFVLSAGYGLVGMSFAYLVTYGVELLVYALILKKSLPDVKMNILHGKLSRLKTLVSFGVVAMVANIGNVLRVNLASLVIGHFLTSTLVTIYRIPSLIIQYFFSIQAAGFGVLAPRFSSLEGAGDKQKLKSLFQGALALSSIFAFGFASMAVVGGGLFMKLWVGDDFAEAVPILWILSIAVAFDLAQAPGINVLYAQNKHRFYAWMNLAEGLLNLLLSVILVQRYGILGVAWGSAAALVLVKVLILPSYVSRRIGLPLLSFFKPVFLMAITGGATIFLGLEIGIVKDWDSFPLALSLLIISGLGVFYLGTSLLLFTLSGIKIPLKKARAKLKKTGS